MEYRYTVYRSPVGTHYLLASPKGLMAVGLNEKFQSFKDQHGRRARGQWKKVEASKDKILRQAVSALDAYFKRGKPLPADLRLDLVGTPFQLKVWKALRRIPFGRTSSYGQIAKMVGHPGASRAIGGACGANPIPLFVPCHRVLASDGRLGGFGGGLAMKEQLLSNEEIGRRALLKRKQKSA